MHHHRHRELGRQKFASRCLKFIFFCNKMRTFKELWLFKVTNNSFQPTVLPATIKTSHPQMELSSPIINSSSTTRWGLLACPFTSSPFPALTLNKTLLGAALPPFVHTLQSSPAGNCTVSRKTSSTVVQVGEQNETPGIINNAVN